MNNIIIAYRNKKNTIIRLITIPSLIIAFTLLLHRFGFLDKYPKSEEYIVSAMQYIIRSKILENIANISLAVISIIICSSCYIFINRKKTNITARKILNKSVNTAIYLLFIIANLFLASIQYDLIIKNTINYMSMVLFLITITMPFILMTNTRTLFRCLLTLT